jgi:3-isopropylmalate/(R)-2-methylmalate dehydratase small subunit
MDPVTEVRSRVIPLFRANLDTDQIIPARLCGAITKEQFADALFRDLRDHDPDFILDRQEMQGRKILAAGANFGCGSSREAAVWALHAHGIRAILAPSFGDIFAGNALKNGIVPVCVSPEWEAAFSIAVRDSPEVEVVVDIVQGTVRFNAPHVAPLSFEIDPFSRYLLIEGKNELEFLESYLPAISAYEESTDLHPTSRSRIGGSSGEVEP